MRGVVLIGSIDPAGADHIDGQLTGEQRPHLNWRGVGSQHDAAVFWLDEQRVLHGAGRMVGDEVERVEVHPLGFELWTFGHLPAHRDEHINHQVHQCCDRLDGAEWLSLDREGYIDPLLPQDAGYLLCL